MNGYVVVKILSLSYLNSSIAGAKLQKKTRLPLMLAIGSFLKEHLLLFENVIILVVVFFVNPFQHDLS
jgi:hypothetical protein